MIVKISKTKLEEVTVPIEETCTCDRCKQILYKKNKKDLCSNIYPVTFYAFSKSTSLEMFKEKQHYCPNCIQDICIESIGLYDEFTIEKVKEYSYCKDIYDDDDSTTIIIGEKRYI